MEQTSIQKRNYVNFLEEPLEGQEITLVIKEGNKSV